MWANIWCAVLACEAFDAAVKVGYFPVAYGGAAVALALLLHGLYLNAVLHLDPKPLSSLKLRGVFTLERRVKRFDGDHIFVDVPAGVKQRA